jgi:hypothetical protein
MKPHTQAAEGPIQEGNNRAPFRRRGLLSRYQSVTGGASGSAQRWKATNSAGTAGGGYFFFAETCKVVLGVGYGLV